MNEKKKDILLIMGNSTGTKDALAYAKSIGIKTIVTDYLPLEKNIAKQQADEYWMIDVSDLDVLEKKCREEGVTGVFAATSEFCLDQTRELCQRLKLPFYASDEGWACSRDKERFKEHCQKCGISVPRQYFLDKPYQRDQLDRIQYPVIVKPVDACAQRGLSLCYNEKELIKGYERALEFSPSKRTIVEEYINGDEIDAFFIIVDGMPILTGFSDKYFIPVNERQNASFQPTPSRFTEEFLENEMPGIEKLFSDMNCQQGAAFLQAIRRDGIFYFLELGYRIDGIGSWVNTKQVNGINCVEMMVDLALGKKCRKELIKNFNRNPNDKRNATYFIWAKPGTILQIKGRDEIQTINGVNIVVDRFQEGDIISKTDSLMQTAFLISIVAENEYEMNEKINKINEMLHIYDETGQELLIYFEDYEKRILNNYLEK